MKLIFFVAKMNKLVLCALVVLAAIAMSEAGHSFGGRGGSEVSAHERAFAGQREGLRKGNRGRLVRKS